MSCGHRAAQAPSLANHSLLLEALLSMSTTFPVFFLPLVVWFLIPPSTHGTWHMVGAFARGMSHREFSPLCFCVLPCSSTEVGKMEMCCVGVCHCSRLFCLILLLCMDPVYKLSSSSLRIHPLEHLEEGMFVYKILGRKCWRKGTGLY